MPETISAASQAAKAKVFRYFEATTEDYLKYYETDWHHHMHYGFDRGLPRGGNPTENLVRYLADLARIRGGETVLDAGCGVGGSSIWLARERKCSCAGITFVESHARLARKFAAAARDNGLKTEGLPAWSAGPKARFLAADFTRPALALLDDVLIEAQLPEGVHHHRVTLRAGNVILRVGGLDGPEFEEVDDFHAVA